MSKSPKPTDALVREVARTIAVKIEKFRETTGLNGTQTATLFNVHPATIYSLLKTINEPERDVTLSLAVIASIAEASGLTISEVVNPDEKFQIDPENPRIVEGMKGIEEQIKRRKIELHRARLAEMEADLAGEKGTTQEPKAPANGAATQPAEPKPASSQPAVQTKPSTPAQTKAETVKKKDSAKH